MFKGKSGNLSQPHFWEECEDDIHTPEMGTWESSETLETSEFDYRVQNTSHSRNGDLGVL